MKQSTGSVRPTTLFVPSGTSISRTPSYSGAATLSLTEPITMQDSFAWRATAYGRTPLERSIDAVGMGRYQYSLLFLTGCGWAADNMWLQGIALIIPRIQEDFGTPQRWIGLASSSTFCGMMIGALAWGSFSDAYGRRPAFNWTLLVSTIFGLLSSLAPSFPLLCLCLFALGTGVGGSMPTDGTLFLENLPTRKRYLLTALSVFFAAGSVVSSGLGLLILPRYSCPDKGACSPEMNRGWRYLLGSLGLLTGTFMVLRVLFFKLFESPKYLVSAGRQQEARVVLQRIAAFNGSPLSLSINDVRNRDSAALVDEDRLSEELGRSVVSDVPQAGRKGTTPASVGKKGYSSLPTEADEEEEQGGEEQDAALLTATRPVSSEAPSTSTLSQPLSPSDSSDADEASSSLATTKWPSLLSWVPQATQERLYPFLVRYLELLDPAWRRTTLLVWAIWSLFSLAFTSFNVYLSTFLERRLGTANRTDVMQDYLIYSLASLPGAILGAWLIETRLGHVRTMALATCLVSLALSFFIFAHSRSSIVLSSSSISLLVSIAYAAIYAHAPMAFSTRLRATGTGTASALSRLAGIAAPVVAGALLGIDESLPFIMALAVFGITAGLILALPPLDGAD